MRNLPLQAVHAFVSVVGALNVELIGLAAASVCSCCSWKKPC